MPDAAEETIGIIVKSPQMALESTQALIELLRIASGIIGGTARSGAAVVRGTGRVGTTLFSGVETVVQRRTGRVRMRALSRNDDDVTLVQVPQNFIKSIRNDLRNHQVKFALGKDRESGDVLLYFKAANVEKVNHALEKVIDQHIEDKDGSKHSISEEIRQIDIEKEARKADAPKKSNNKNTERATERQRGKRQEQR